MADYNWGLILILYITLGFLIRRNFKDHEWEYWLDPVAWFKKHFPKQ